MGPFPHDAPPATISDSNPAGTDGFEFVEFAHPEPEKLADLFERMGYAAGRPARTKNITVWRQGDINYVLNARAAARMPCASSTSTGPARRRWPGASSMPGTRSTMRVVEGREPYDRQRQGARRAGDRRHRRLAALFRRHATARRARPTTANSTGWASATRSRKGVGFYYLDHLTHNVYRGNMDKWWAFYRELFGFKQIHFFDIDGKLTGLVSRAHHLALRQDPHPAQRVDRRQAARSRNICGNTRAKASSTSPSAPTTSTTRPTGSPPTA